MEINADFTREALVHAAEQPWIPSPTAGVDRRMLDRIGDEVARATSIVRYAKDSAFPAHTHGGGEEFLVLEGVFQDESGDFPAGSYVRNPPTSRHTPRSEPGCVIFVKLWQFDPADRTGVHRDIHALEYLEVSGREGVRAALLHEDARETVTVEHWAAGVSAVHTPSGGLEVLVLEGELHHAGEVLRPQSWLRLPVAAAFEATAGSEGVLLWSKQGHLAHALSLPDAP